MRHVVLITSLLLSVGAVAQDANPVAEADGLLAKRGLKNCRRAVELYRGALKAKPGDAELQLKTADALNCVMRIQTNGNALLIKGTSDTSAHKKIWAKLGPESWDLAQKAYAQKPKDIKTLAVYTDSYMFYSSSFGILKAITKGAAGQYTDNAKALIKRAPKWDGGLGHVFMGAYYLIAPWPLSDGDKARDHMEKALKTDPKSMRNNYYMGVVAYREGEYAQAIKHFDNALGARCPTPTERDFCGFMKRESKRAKSVAQGKL